MSQNLDLLAIYNNTMFNNIIFNLLFKTFFKSSRAESLLSFSTSKEKQQQQ